MKAVAFDRLDRSVVKLSTPNSKSRAIHFPPVRIDARLVPHTFFARQPPALQSALPHLARLARAEVKFNNPPFIVVANSDRDQRLVVSGSKAKKHTLSQDGEKLRALSEVEGRCVFIVNQAGVIERKLKLNRFDDLANEEEEGNENDRLRRLHEMELLDRARAFLPDLEQQRARRGATSETRGAEEAGRDASQAGSGRSPKPHKRLLTPPDMSGPSYRASGSEDSDDAGHRRLAPISDIETARRWEEGQSGHCSVRFGCCPEVSSEQETTDRAGTELQERKTKTELLIDETILLRSELRMKEIERMVPTTRWNIDKAKADLRDLRMALITTKECGIKLIGEDKTLVRGRRAHSDCSNETRENEKNDPNTEMENAAAV
ncbi:hypothetical protein BLNAU_3438 [Blattamonas nauphoetae]|uniref:Uncharacterized protein n=1 Tax=Blattamonas nauphoetae TaxID=2049346 RepID=A0ABQ9YD63_9EUKA|nr:hypothetical protein BLNAU_3438 [Blattamonas nauphoetae]